MSSNQRRDALRQAVATATSFPEQQAAVAALDAFDQHQRTAAQTSRDVDWADTVIAQTLQPVAVHERSTIETDWLGDYEPDNSPAAHHAAIAEVAMWFDRTSPEVRADREEFGTQAEGFVRRVASAYGDEAPAIQSEALTYLGFLYRQGASGLDQIQQTVDPHENPKTTPLNPETFDNFADEVHPINAGVVGTETSERAPLLQEIEQEGSGQGQAEVEGGHSTDNVAEGPPAPYANTVADSGSLGYATSVAIDHRYNLDEFRQREAASGLDQIQQVVDSQENPKPTPLNDEVQFPWLIGPDAYGNGGAKKESSRQGRDPFAREAATAASKSAALKTAGGDFYKDQSDPHQSWYDHPDYHTHYQHGHDSSGRFGEPIQFRDSESDEDRYEWEGADTHDLTRGEYEHQMDHPNAGNGARSAWMDGWVDRSAGNDRNRMLMHQWRNRKASKTTHTDGDCPECHSGNYHKEGSRIVCANCGHEAPKSWTKGASLQTEAKRSGTCSYCDEPTDDLRYSKGNGNLCPDCDSDLGDDSSIWDESGKRKDGQGHPDWKPFESSLQTKADMYGNSDTDHQVVGPQVANDPGTAPVPGGGYQQGYADGQAADAPTVADASSAIPPKQKAYSEGYGDGAHARADAASKDIPPSLRGAASLVRSASFVAEATAQDPEFTKGYNFASKWEPGKPLVTTGSLTFEEGLYAGLVDWPDNRDAWRAAHRRQAHRDEQFATRMARHDDYTDYLVTKGIDVTARNHPFGTRDACTKCGTDIEYVGHRPDPAKEFLKIDRGSGWWDRGGNFSCPRGGTHDRADKTAARIPGYESGDTVYHPQHGKGEIEHVDDNGTAHVQYEDSGANVEHPQGTLRKRKPKDDDWGSSWNVTAATTTEMDTLNPSTSPSATGETPINGPGKPPPLEGGVDPARPGGPSPYNGVEPLGAPAVPNGVAAAQPGNQYVNDIPGGPLDGNTKGLAFRRTVQSTLLAQKKKD